DAGFGSATSGDLSGAAGSDDAFALKLDASSGILAYAKRLGGTLSDQGLGIASASAGVYVTGYFQGNAGFSSATSGLLSSAGSSDIFLLSLVDNSPPAISGATTSNVGDNTNVSPFGNLTISDADAGDNLTVSVSFNSANG